MAKLHHIEIHPDAKTGTFKGGQVHTHFIEEAAHSSKGGITSHYVEPEKKSFGENEGHDLIAHVANNLNIPTSGGIEYAEPEND